MTATADIAEAKAALRSAALARRDAMSPAERAAASTAIAARILDIVPPGATVSAFLPIRSEVDLDGAIEALLARGHAVGLPVMAGRSLLFRRFAPDAPLVPLGFGTRGPGEDAPTLDPEVMLVPFSAFDRRLNRIGYGKAYYDTTIAALRAAGRDPLLVGVGFAVQEAARVPVEPHDVPLHRIVTEREVILPPRGA